MLLPCQKHPNSQVKMWRLTGVGYWTAGCVLHADCWVYGGSRQSVTSDWNFQQQQLKTSNTKKGKAK